jgi:hypothetical protein
MPKGNKPIKYTSKGVSVSNLTGKQKKKGKKIKTRYSVYMITINTNKRYGNSGQRLSDATAKLEKAANSFLTKFEDGRFVSFYQDEEAKWDSKWIKSVRTRAAIEKGDNANQLHLHMMIKIKHKTRVQLKYKPIKDFFVKKLGIGNIYMFVNRYKKDTKIEDVLNKYLKKNQVLAEE